MKTVVAVRLLDQEPLPLPGHTPRLPLRPVHPLRLQLLPRWVPQSRGCPELSWEAVGEAWGAAALAQGSANAEDRLEAALEPWARSLEEGNPESQVQEPVRTRRKVPAITVRMSTKTQRDYRLWTLPLWNSRSIGLKRL